MSFGGVIVAIGLNTLQLISIAPLNRKSYRCLTYSIIIPKNNLIIIILDSNSQNLLIIIDGENIVYSDVIKIDTVVNKKIKCIRLENYAFFEKINKKFL